MKTIFKLSDYFVYNGMAGQTLSKMKASVKKTQLVPNVNRGANTNSNNNISKFQKAALLPTQAKAVKGGEGSDIVIEELIIG